MRVLGNGQLKASLLVVLPKERTEEAATKP
jgi:hypothetical protein